jgi:hypothetical protein
VGLRALPRVNEWLYTVSSRGITTRPSTLLSKSVTPAQNAYGSYTQLIAGASVTDDCYEFELLVGTVAIAASARDCLVTIGIDEAGGTSYTRGLERHRRRDQRVTYFSAGSFNAVGFRIPLRIKAGTSVAIKASVNSATLTNDRGRLHPAWPADAPRSRVGRQLRADVRREHGSLRRVPRLSRVRAPRVRGRAIGTIAAGDKILLLGVRVRHQRRDDDRHRIQCGYWHSVTRATSA